MKKSLHLLLLLLFPIGLQAQSEVIVLRPDEGKAEVIIENVSLIFILPYPAGKHDRKLATLCVKCSQKNRTVIAHHPVSYYCSIFLL